MPLQSEDSITATLPFRNAGVPPALLRIKHNSHPSPVTQSSLFRIVQDVCDRPIELFFTPNQMIVVLVLPKPSRPSQQSICTFRRVGFPRVEHFS